MADRTPSFEYRPKSQRQLKSNYKSRCNMGTNGFYSFDSFHKWYCGTKKICHYCGLTELQSQEIVVRELLTSKRFPQKGHTGPGKARGMWLEVDRINPKRKYSNKNCVLACYFCNNDKSDVFNGDDYKRFFQNRYKFLKKLLQKSK
ncbi:MAG: hypothetical protein JST38_11320 [Bacteroidetes bacterium]|nr:hypothetical protein [Bacteroidota bacterium]MBS1941450.1 hypothetical protein [Bacteroidota bacterium]